MMVPMSTATSAEARLLSVHLTHRLSSYVEALGQLCSIECPSGFSAGVDAASAWVREWAAKRDWDTQTFPDADAGTGVMVSVHGDAPEGPRILMAAHLDTVYPVGVAASRPMVADGDRLLAPGVADNKSGLLSGLYAMAALEDLDLLGSVNTVTLVCGADEETDMRTSLALFEEIAARYDLALVLEAARENGDIVEARKTSAFYVLEEEGREAHAGVEPHRGANAILALAHRIIRLQALNDMRPGVTVNVGVVRGGTLSNVVPGHARAEIDVRAVAPADLEPVADAIRRIVEESHISNTHATLSGGWKAPAMPCTPEIADLVTIAQLCAVELGFDLGSASTGGISYANYLAGLGLPVLDGLGPVGGLDHSPAEYILASSIVPRTALLALLILRRSQALSGEVAATRVG